MYGENLWNVDNQKEFVKKVGVEIGVKYPDDWYAVDVKTIEERGGAGVSSSMCTL